MKITVLQGQSLLDLVIQHCGDVAKVFELAMENGLTISDELVAGQSLQLPASCLKPNEIVNYYKSKNIQPATGIATEQLNEYVFPVEGLPFIL